MTNDTPLTIGAVIRSERICRHRTMRDVHSRGGPTPAYQCDVEQGKKTNVGVDTLLKWCAAIGCSAVEIIRRLTAPEETTTDHGPFDYRDLHKLLIQLNERARKNEKMR